VPPPSARRLALPLAALIAALVAGAGVSTASATPAFSAPYARTIDEAPGTRLRLDRLARTAIAWRGGPITTSTGETVTVLVSDSLDASVTPESWAEFIAHLPHGSEISKLTAYIASLDEVGQLCGPQALGCYQDDQLVGVGQTQIDGTTTDEVIRHEYGHHIAFNRSNPPWVAVDWGPKYWASTLDVCGRAARGSAFPGDEGSHYDQNPGEAWAETYRLLAERQAGIVTAGWPIVSPSFFPTEAAFQAAERDVLQPWTAGKAVTYRRQFTKKGKKVWLIHLQTPLDGSLSVSSTFPNGGLYGLTLVGANGRTVLKRGFFSGSRTERLVTSVCGQRSLFVRVTQKGAFGRVSVTASTP
jgi:hypothetical protein